MEPFTLFCDRGWTVIGRNSTLIMQSIIRYGLILLGCSVALWSCGESKQRVPADAPGYIKGKAVHPSIKIGRPYRVMGRKYYPEYDPDYDEEGLASWYGPNFHGKMTANGEKYNQWAMTAAHKTLPMPSMVRVTNLATGKSIVVRVNDRGPFADGRIIDLSRAAAEELGTRARGIAKVRVQYLRAETEQYIARLQLKKPKEMREIDLAQAKIDSAFKEQHKVTSTPQEPPKPKHIEQAQEVPEHFAYEEDVQEITTTVDVRGVKMEEIGYAEDAFSVLDKHSFSVPSANMKANTHAASWQRPVAHTQRYYVQAGTFSNRNNAYALADKLASLSDVQVNPITINDRSFWRVSLGPAFNQGIAEEIRHKLTDYAIYDAAIIKEK